MTIQLGNFCCPDSARQVKHADHNKYKKYKQIEDEVQNPFHAIQGEDISYSAAAADIYLAEFGRLEFDVVLVHYGA